jgi:hypothetical protein
VPRRSESQRSEAFTAPPRTARGAARRRRRASGCR